MRALRAAGNAAERRLWKSEFTRIYAYLLSIGVGGEKLSAYLHSIKGIDKQHLLDLLRTFYPRVIDFKSSPTKGGWKRLSIIEDFDAKKQPFQHCAKCEDVPGNDDAPNSAKEQLAHALGGEKSALELAEWMRGIEFDAQGASAMPSFAAFHDRLQLVLGEMRH